MLALVKSGLRAITPAPVMRYHRARSRVGHAAAEAARQPDVALVAQLCPRGCVAIDVGANVGVFTHPMSRRARVVHAFEPNADLADMLETAFMLNRRVRVHRLALSDAPGITWLRIPLHEGKQVTGLATIEAGNDVAGLPVNQAPVTVTTLDQFPHYAGRIGFLKIDVEGHEMAVLRGAVHLLRRDRPNVLVEAEERHRAGTVRELFAFMEAQRYRGWFLWRGQLRPLIAFDPDVHQRADAHDALGRCIGGRAYANNFVFRPDGA